MRVVLEDCTQFKGQSFGSSKAVEVAFNAGMSGFIQSLAVVLFIYTLF